MNATVNLDLHTARNRTKFLYLWLIKFQWVTEFVNADTIALGLSAFNPEKAAFHVGRVMLNRLQQLAEDHENFAFETTLTEAPQSRWVRFLSVLSLVAVSRICRCPCR